MKIKILTSSILCLLITPLITLAQGDAYLFGSIDFGIPKSTYLDNKNTLSNRFYSNHSAFNIATQYRIKNRIGIEGGIGQHFEYLAFNDPKFTSRNPGFESDSKSKNAFLNAYGALQLLQPLNGYSRIYLLGGYSLNLVTGPTVASKTSLYVAGQEYATFSSQYFNNTSVFGEIGWENTLADESVISLGFKVNWGLDKIMTGDYYVTKTSNFIEKDRITSYGTYFGLSLRYGWNYFHKEPGLKPFEETVKEEVKITPPKNEPKVVVKPPKNDNIPQVVEGRHVSVTNKITVKSVEVTIKVWDHEIVDGDTISLNFNGKWILQKYCLEKNAKVIHVTLQNGTNYLVLHAHNLGKYAPNTAAIIVDDGKKANQVILQSNLNASGTIQIDVK